MNFSDAGYMYTNHIYGLSEANRLARIARMRRMLQDAGVDFAIFCGKGYGGLGAWFTGLTNPEYPGEMDGAYVLPLQGNLMELGAASAMTPEMLANQETLDVMQAPFAPVAHLRSEPGLSAALLQSLVGTHRRIGLVNGAWLRASLADLLKQAAPSCSLVELTQQALGVLLEKSHEELQAMALVARCHDRCFGALAAELLEGRTERDIVCRLRRYLLDFGAAGQDITHVMPVLLTSAPQNGAAAVTPLGYPGRRLCAGDRVNIATTAAGYSDLRAGIGRCFVLGSATEETRRCWNGAVAAQDAAAAQLRHGATVRCGVDAANAVLTQQGFAPDTGDVVFGLGYEATAFSDPDTKLVEGMTVVIAPSVRLPGQDAYCCMDTYAIGPSGASRLSEASRALVEVKNF